MKAVLKAKTVSQKDNDFFIVSSLASKKSAFMISINTKHDKVQTIKETLPKSSNQVIL